MNFSKVSTHILMLAFFIFPGPGLDAAPFIRGDADGNGQLEVTDPIQILGHLFLGEPGVLDCSDAADANDTGELDISDPVYILTFVFVGGTEPPGPFPGCGEDITPDVLDCVSHAQCMSGDVVKSAKERELSPDLEDGQLEELVSGNTAFALDLYRSIRQDDANTGKNIFYSPYSISSALGMTYAGARNETAQQIATVFHFTLLPERLHSAFNALDLAIASRGQNVDPGEGDGFQLTVANALWGQKDYPFLMVFLDVLAENYGAGMRIVDYRTAPEPARLTINDWVEDQTNGRIKDLLPQGVITVLTRLVLTNAIFFKASWLSPFNENLTQDGPFHLLDGSQNSVPMMKQETEYGYVRGEDYQAVELPYLGEELSMVVVMPDPGQFESFEDSLDAAGLTGIFEGLSTQEVLLTVPKFNFEFTLPLKAILIEMGMVHPFDNILADFNGIADFADTQERLFIHDVLHKAFVGVDEKGTEAAAATAVIIGTDSVPPSITVDRPFLFMIRDRTTNAILFLGRVLDPSA